MQQSFGSMEMVGRLDKNSTLNKVDVLINWDLIRSKLRGLYKRDQSKKGRKEPFDPLMMFKAILLGQWHSLSDSIPDETTLC